MGKLMEIVAMARGKKRTGSSCIREWDFLLWWDFCSRTVQYRECNKCLEVAHFCYVRFT
jgi:hypothetical protein